MSAFAFKRESANEKRDQSRRIGEGGERVAGNCSTIPLRSAFTVFDMLERVGQEGKEEGGSETNSSRDLFTKHQVLHHPLTRARSAASPERPAQEVRER